MVFCCNSLHAGGGNGTVTLRLGIDKRMTRRYSLPRNCGVSSRDKIKMPSKTISIPLSAFEALEVLAALPPDRLAVLSNLIDTVERSLDFRGIVQKLAAALSISEQSMLLLAGLLLALNQLRTERKLTAEQLIVEVANAIDRQGSDEWKKEWQKPVIPALQILIPFLQPNNLFATAGKAQLLWKNRPTTALDFKILTDLRPVFDENASKTVAIVLTNTLVIEFYDDSTKTQRAIHLSLDQDNLESLGDEVERAQNKNRTMSGDCIAWGIDLLSQGGA